MPEKLKYINCIVAFYLGSEGERPELSCLIGDKECKKEKDKGNFNKSCLGW